MANIFSLSGKLRLFLSLGSSNKLLRLGNKLPVSIRRRFTFSQTIMLYPESDYGFFSAYEISNLMSMVDVLGLSFYVCAENGVPIIEISDNDVNDD